jgi:hypothetical protein
LTPSEFRRDPWLRTSAYALATWSLAGFLLEVRLRAAGTATEDGIAATIVIAGASLLASRTHARRVAKMAGQAGEPVFANAKAMWRLIVAAALLLSVVAVRAGRTDLVFPLWMLAAGSGFAAWGRAVGLGWYVGLGALMAGIGLLDLLLSRGSFAAYSLEMFTLGLLLPAAAIATNRQFLWIRAAGPA